MNIDLNGRGFQLWEYQVTHGKLLIRSPGVDGKKNIDLIFYGVTYISCPRHIANMEVDEVLEDKKNKYENIFGVEIVDTSRIWIIQKDPIQAIISANSFTIEENSKDLLESVFINV